jgi:medium-chain acyl-[acyl-carrier-protein] hydrolase
MRLICFPYAGGSASAFRSLAGLMPETIELMAVQFPGREARFSERPSADMASVIDNLADAIAPFLDMPYATFGHSLGTITSYELVHKLSQLGLPKPEHMVMSGRGAPHIKSDKPLRYLLPDAQFIEALRELQGTQLEVLENDEMMQLLLPLLRADFTLAESYACDQPLVLPCGLSVYGGLTDVEVPKRDLEAWKVYTRDPITLRMFPGGHFFIHGAPQLLLQALVRDLGMACASLA